MKKLKTCLCGLILLAGTLCVSGFSYELSLNPVEIPGLPGIHSFAFAQHEGRWLVAGGRTDGLHARQPGRSFPAEFNNTKIFVIDIKSKTIHSSSIGSLPVTLREQLQTTNMNFYQDEDILYYLGGYAYSRTAGDHITFPYLTAIDVPGIIKAVEMGTELSEHMKQIKDEQFAVTGGQLGKLGDTFLLVGGHRFDGRYNPVGPLHGPGFRQEYTQEIRMFEILHNSRTMTVSNFRVLRDEEHLHRRDFNLVAQILPDGSPGYMVSAGVFQKEADLPFLYPVFVSLQGYEPVEKFSQLLSHYHGAKAALYDEDTKEMHSLFFGGISQYYYQDGNLVRDDRVPFVRTISRVSRYDDGILHEYAFPVKMPGFLGASAEFLVNPNLAVSSNGVILLNQIPEDDFVIGHILGGIDSPLENPFSTNRTHLTGASNMAYEVRLMRKL